MVDFDAVEQPYRCRSNLSRLLLYMAIMVTAFELYVVFAGHTLSAKELFDLAWPLLLLWGVAVFQICADRQYAIWIREDMLVISNIGWRGLKTEEITYQSAASFSVGESRTGGPVLIIRRKEGGKVKTRVGITDFAGMCRKLEVKSGKTGILPPWIPG